MHPQLLSIRIWLTGLLTFVILVLLSLAGGLVNDSLGIENGHTNFFDGLLIKLLFTILVIVFGFLPISLPNAFRVPLFRTFVWGSLVIAGNLWPLTMDGDFYKYLHTSNGNLCSLYNTFLYLISVNEGNSTLWLHTGLIGLGIFALFLLFVVTLANYFSGRLLIEMRAFKD